MAVVAGLAMLAAFPPYGLWPLAPLLSWTNLHTGYLPWVLLSLLQAGYLALLGAAGAYASALVERWRWRCCAGTWARIETRRRDTPWRITRQARVG